MWTKWQGVQAADGALHSYRSQLAELQSEHASVMSDLSVVRQQLQDALAEAAQALLPDASPPTLTRVAQQYGLGWLATRRQELEKKRAEWVARLAQIEKDPSFVRRHALLHATRGELVLEHQQIDVHARTLETHFARFHTETFRWIQNRTIEGQGDRGALGSFWDAVTFGGYREQKAKERCAQELGYPSYDHVVTDHQQTDLKLRQAKLRLQHIASQRQQLLAMLEEHGKLYAWTNDFEARVCAMLRTDVQNALVKADLRGVHARSQPPIRGAIARAHALTKKGEYLVNLRGFLERQTADRQQRIQAIERTRMAWAMKPRDRISGNKAKWLMGLPTAKKESTHKQVRFCRRMHHNIIDFDDYDDYDYYLGHHSFLAYDAFAWASDEPMPYEGFSREIVPEIQSYREEQGQAKADYGMFKDMDKQAAAEERAAAAAEARVGEDHFGADTPHTPDEPSGAFGYDEAAGEGGAAEAEDLSDAEAGIETDDSGEDTEDSS